MASDGITKTALVDSQNANQKPRERNVCDSNMQQLNSQRRTHIKESKSMVKYSPEEK